MFCFCRTIFQKYANVLLIKNLLLTLLNQFLQAMPQKRKASDDGDDGEKASDNDDDGETSTLLEKCIHVGVGTSPATCSHTAAGTSPSLFDIGISTQTNVVDDDDDPSDNPVRDTEILFSFPPLPRCLYMSPEEKDSIAFGEVIGKGKYSSVLKVTFQNNIYALKVFDSDEDIVDFNAEARIMASFNGYVILFISS
jgi:hypothetical protein